MARHLRQRRATSYLVTMGVRISINIFLLVAWTRNSEIKISQSLIHCEKTKLRWKKFLPNWHATPTPSYYELENEAPCGIDVTQRNGCLSLNLSLNPNCLLNCPPALPPAWRRSRGRPTWSWRGPWGSRCPPGTARPQPHGNPPWPPDNWSRFIDCKFGFRWSLSIAFMGCVNLISN